MLLQNPNDLLFRKAAALHALVLVVGQNELQTGLSPRGKVNRISNVEFEFARRGLGIIRTCGCSWSRFTAWIARPADLRRGELPRG